MVICDGSPSKLRRSWAATVVFYDGNTQVGGQVREDTHGVSSVGTREQGCVPYGFREVGGIEEMNIWALLTQSPDI